LTQKIFFPVVVLIGLMLHSCAKIGTISGGPKDVTPPKVLSSKPANRSTHFDGKEINIAFNEFISLKDLTNQLVVSPPLKHTPDTRVIAKGLLIILSDTFLTNMTYNLNFANSIVDYTEGNILKNYEYVFSTGDYIDSLSLKGTLLSAFDHKQGKDKLFVSLYSNLSDSAPLKEKPLYLAKTDDKGNFTFHNLKAGKYKLYGLKDANSNLKFDMPTESFAFSDSTIELNAKHYYHKDTVPVLDSAMILDSLKKNPKAKLKIPVFKPQVEIFSFIEPPKKQYLTNSERKDRKKLTFAFNMPVDSITIQPLYYKGTNKWFITENNFEGDTLNFWITDSTLYKSDTLKVVANYMFTDSAGRLVPRRDTIQMNYAEKLKSSAKKAPKDGKAPKDEKGKKTQKKKNAENFLVIKSNVQTGTDDLDMIATLEAEHPLSQMDKDKIDLSLKKNDSTYIPQEFKLIHDSLHFRNYQIQYKWQAEAEYQLYIEPKAFTDVYGLSNDTIQIDFKIQKEEYYGKIFLNVTNVKQDMIVQLMTEKESIVQQRKITKDEKLEFDYVKAAKYLIKVIYDRNGNGQWDTGDYLKKIQPEKVDYYPDKINVRANWDLELSLPLK
jgi:uncharacterized protein (DUF2141 family)